MRRPKTLIVRGLALLAALALLQLALAPAAHPAGPYLSALSDIATGPPAFAAHCANKTCGSFGGPCLKAVGFFCANSAGQCFTRGCQ